MIFSRNLRRLMDRDGVKQKELGAALGVVQGAVSAWVNGKTPDFPNQQKLAKYFRVTVADLFTGPSGGTGAGVGGKSAENAGDNKKPESAEVLEMREQFNELIANSPEAIAALKPILNYLREGKKVRKKTED